MPVFTCFSEGLDLDELRYSADGRLTDDDDACVYGQDASPRDRCQRRPLCIHGSWLSSIDLVPNIEDDTAYHLRHDVYGNRQAFDDEIRNIKVGRGRQCLGQGAKDEGRALYDPHNG
jgi:hypothetical protein